MDSNTEAQIKSVILEKIVELEDELVNLKEMTRPMGLDSAIGRVSRMDYINNKSINEAQLKKTETKIKALNNWLAKVGTADFGKCIRCGNEININRLLFLPESNLCIKCASRP